MDPDVTMKSLQAAWHSGDFENLALYARQLKDWIERGGHFTRKDDLTGLCWTRYGLICYCEEALSVALQAQNSPTPD